MTTRSDPYLIPYSKLATSSGGWRRSGLTFALTLVAIVVFAASFAIGYARVHEGRVLPGVAVAGVSLAGLNRAQSATELSRDLPSLTEGDLVVAIEDDRQSVAYSSFERQYDLEYMLDQAFNIGRGPTFVEQLQEQLRVLLNGVDIQPAVTWNNEELVGRVAALVMAAQRDPMNATIERVDGRYVVSPASEGMSVDVESAVNDAVAAINNTSPTDAQITVRTSVVPPQITTTQAQAAVDTVERVVGAGLSVSGAELATEISSDVLRGWAHLDETAPGEWQLVIERDPVRQFVENYALQTDIAPQNATFRFASGNNFEVVPSAEGRAADVDTTTDSIMAALQARADGGQAPPTANLALVTVPPTFKTEDARAISSSVTKIGEWTTNFTPSNLNGNGINISIPTSIINGYVVEPGQVFDFLKVIGPITSPPYAPGAAIIHNRTVIDGALGGGMCSCSTTLFNAAMRAGLDIGARRNHSYYIARYPVGLDATVWIASARSRQTMSFTNDLQYPVLIRGINGQGAVTFELYGVPDGRTVHLSEPVVENEQKADEFYEYTNELAPGRRSRIEYAVDGFNSTVVRTVRDAQGNVIHEDTWKSRYKTITGLVLVGRYPTDPPAGRKVLVGVWRATHGPGRTEE